MKGTGIKKPLYKESGFSRKRQSLYATVTEPK
jgi:hypothetical protein